MRFDPDFYVYPIGRNPTTLGTVALTFLEEFDQVAISNDADFECKRLVAFAIENENDAPTEFTRRIPDFNFNIRDNSTGRLMFNTFVSTAELFGDGRIPFVLPTTHFFKRSTIVQMLYDPVDPGPDFDNIFCWLALVGAKHYSEVQS